MPELLATDLVALLTALGAGLLIGAVRERQHDDPLAGIRTHALVSVLAAVALHLHLAVLLVVLGLLSILIVMGYRRGIAKDPGMTGEVSLILSALLGALSLSEPGLAAGVAVVAAVLLYAKASLHRITRELISEREVHDGLVLLASALVVLPLLPDHAVGPYLALNPALLWKLAVLVMAISAMGHAALRLIGNRWGLTVSGFFAGYVSSTAAVAGFGQRVKESPKLLRPAVGAAMLSNLASLSLFGPVLMTLAPGLLRLLLPQLVAASLVLLLGGMMGLRGEVVEQPVTSAETRMFRITHAFGFVAIIASVWLISAAMNDWLGSRGALVAAMIAALAELHAAVATLGHLYLQGILDVRQLRWGLFGLLAASTLAKSVVAFISGGRAYGIRVAAGLLAMLMSVMMVMVIL